MFPAPFFDAWETSPDTTGAKALGAHGHDVIDVEGQEAPSPTAWMICVSCGMLMKCVMYYI